jgi:hypothetical protein
MIRGTPKTAPELCQRNADPDLFTRPGRGDGSRRYRCGLPAGVPGGKRWGVEFQYGDAPRVSKSMRVALVELKLERLWVLYPGEKDYALDPRIEVVAMAHVEELAHQVGG